jgi:hypothetical protein
MAAFFLRAGSDRDKIQLPFGHTKLESTARYLRTEKVLSSISAAAYSAGLQRELGACDRQTVQRRLFESQPTNWQKTSNRLRLRKY